MTSSAYSDGASTGYNGLTIPVVALTAYVTRPDATRLGWHTGGAIHGPITLLSETNVTAAGSAAFGVISGAYDYFESPGDTFNGTSVGTTGLGGGTILATIATDTLAAYWKTGDAPGDTVTARQTAFPGPRLLYNLDNDAPGNDITNMTAAGQTAFINVLDFYTPLIKTVPEPSSILTLGLGALLVASRRRRSA